MLLVELEMYKNNPRMVIVNIRAEEIRRKTLGSIFFVLIFLFCFLADINMLQLGIPMTRELQEITLIIQFTFRSLFVKRYSRIEVTRGSDEPDYLFQLTS